VLEDAAQVRELAVTMIEDRGDRVVSADGAKRRRNGLKILFMSGYAAQSLS
jgi:hypothetical protein